MQMWSIDYSLHLLYVFSVLFFFPSSSFYCELLPLLCVIFPIHTQAISMSHSKCSLLQSMPKVLLQTDSLFMVFSSINGLLSADTMGFIYLFYKCCREYYFYSQLKGHGGHQRQEVLIQHTSILQCRESTFGLLFQSEILFTPLHVNCQLKLFTL